MSKELAVILLGFWVIILTQLGIPGSWRTGLFVITGFVIIGVGFALRAQVAARRNRQTPHHGFVENSSHSDSSHDTPDSL